jgi:glycosyltransferase involved in cell wall biosynthesis
LPWRRFDSRATRRECSPEVDIRETMVTAGPYKSIDLPGVNFYSPIGVASGLGSAGRGYLAALRAAGVPVSLVPVHELFVHQSSVRSVERRQRPRYPISIVHINADSVHRFLHYHARTFARSQYKIAIWVWELPAFRDEWWKELSQFDEIWVPSTFCQRAVQAVTAKPVIVMPHVVSANEAPQPGYRDKLQIGAGEVAFLYVFDATSLVARKNPDCLVDAFEAAFSDHDRVRLVLKVSDADKDPEFSKYLDRLAGRNARSVVLRQTMGAHELAGLVCGCDCYVSPHRSEGFGLTVAEAMALGMPVIATDYGGTADFVTEEVGFPLRYRLVEVDRNHGPYAKGSIWADPSREHLQALLRSVVMNPGGAAERGRRARSHMLKGYSAAAVGRRIAERLAAIAPGRPRPPVGE